MKNIFFFLIVSLAFVSCKKEEQEKPKVIYESKSQAKPQVDTSKADIADLPVHMEGTNFLIFPVPSYPYCFPVLLPSAWLPVAPLRKNVPVAFPAVLSFLPHD